MEDLGDDGEWGWLFVEELKVGWYVCRREMGLLYGGGRVLCFIIWAVDGVHKLNRQDFSGQLCCHLLTKVSLYGTSLQDNVNICLGDWILAIRSGVGYVEEG